MTDSSIPVVGTGQSLQTYKNTIAGEQVHSEAVTLTDQNGVPLPVTDSAPASNSLGLVVRVVGDLVLGSSVEVNNDSGNPIPVSATDLDIRDLVFATDKVDASGSTVSVSNFPATQAISGSVSVSNFPATQAVSATDLDIRDLSRNTDSILIYGSDDGGTTKRVIKTDSGGAIQVDLEVASVTVTNAAGAAAVNIQDGGNSITVDNAGTFAVQVSSTVPGTGATNLGKAEDASHTSGDTGVMLLGVRNDQINTTFTSNNGDYSPIATDAQGRTITADNKVEDSPHLSTDTGSFGLGVRNDDAATSFTNVNGDYTPYALTDRGEQFVTSRTGANALNIQDGGNSITVDNGGTFAVQATQSGSWSVTANAGTNLNTSALALESGGNLAAAAASLNVMDDWDESDRAKVNLIASQAGVDGGSGASSAKTLRTILSTDDPSLALLLDIKNAILALSIAAAVPTYLAAGENFNVDEFTQADAHAPPILAAGASITVEQGGGFFIV